MNKIKIERISKKLIEGNEQDTYRIGYFSLLESETEEFSKSLMEFNKTRGISETYLRDTHSLVEELKKRLFRDFNKKEVKSLTKELDYLDKLIERTEKSIEEYNTTIKQTSSFTVLTLAEEGYVGKYIKETNVYLSKLKEVKETVVKRLNKEKYGDELQLKKRLNKNIRYLRKKITICSK